ncbi:MAG TPA: DUF177 domain-containing protein [Acidimicrobiales bacterium]
MTADPWLIPVLTLRRQPGARRQECRTGRIGELSVAGSVVPASAEATADAILDAVDGGIEVVARIHAPWEGECRRCLRPLGSELHCEVRELYRTRTADEAADPDEDTYPLDGDQLDLRPLVRDALLLALPLAPLCRDDCLGLCPACGADRNVDPCGCQAAAGDPRWGALDVLRSPEGEPGLG